MTTGTIYSIAASDARRPIAIFHEININLNDFHVLPSTDINARTSVHANTNTHTESSLLSTSLVIIKQYSLTTVLRNSVLTYHFSSAAFAFSIFIVPLDEEKCGVLQGRAIILITLNIYVIFRDMDKTSLTTVVQVRKKP